jgi:DNA-binding transcriptional MocR family regulator
MPQHIPFAYERVEARIASMISNGLIRPGERVPSVREICVSDSVSKATAMQALCNLEARSLVFARPRSGYFAMASSRLPLPTTPVAHLEPREPKLSPLVARVFADVQNPATMALGAGTPHPSLLPTAELARSAARAARLHVEDFGRYPTCEADRPLRREIALRLARVGCEVSPEEVVITNGCMDALNLSLRAVASPGDTILVESPTFFGILQMIHSLGMKAISVPATCIAGLDVKAFERTLAKHKIAACVLLPSFGNPHGACVSEEHRQAIAHIANKHRAPIIEDDVYGELAFDGRRLRPLKAYPNAAGTILCGSLSKCLSPALRIGWAIAGCHAENVRRMKWISSIATPHITARAAADYLQCGGFDRHLRAMRHTLEQQTCCISHAISEFFPEGTALSRPSGGYFLWVELPRHISAEKLGDAAIQHRISICPGPIFSLNGEFENCIRLNCAVGVEQNVQEAIATLGRLAHEQAASSFPHAKRPKAKTTTR